MQAVCTHGRKPDLVPRLEDGAQEALLWFREAAGHKEHVFREGLGIPLLEALCQELPLRRGEMRGRGGREGGAGVGRGKRLSRGGEGSRDEEEAEEEEEEQEEKEEDDEDEEAEEEAE